MMIYVFLVLLRMNIVILVLLIKIKIGVVKNALETEFLLRIANVLWKWCLVMMINLYVWNVEKTPIMICKKIGVVRLLLMSCILIVLIVKFVRLVLRKLCIVISVLRIRIRYGLVKCVMEIGCLLLIVNVLLRWFLVLKMRLFARNV